MSDMPDWMKRMNLDGKQEFSRRLVPLVPGEKQPTYALGPPPSPGFRWETDAEFRERIKKELADGL
jgi:hypothetical protein